MPVNFAFRKFELTHQRENYRELLDLTLMFLGRLPPRGMSFIKPGAIHRVRFMSRLIYTLKIVLFRDAGFKHGSSQFLLRSVHHGFHDCLTSPSLVPMYLQSGKTQQSTLFQRSSRRIEMVKHVKDELLVEKLMVRAYCHL